MVGIFDNNVFKAFNWILCCFSLLIFTMGLSWQINVASNFFYPILYKALSIDETISKYASANKFDKQDFIDTTTEQHIQLFAEIVKSINNHGTDLANITYENKSKEIKPLFTQAEIIHLKDVSQLIDNATNIWFLDVVVLIVFIYFFSSKKFEPPVNSHKKWILAIVVSFIGGVFLYFGFTRIFYYLHTVVFPEGHQWFFYYQDSLMSTLMKAPDLFAVIGLLIFIMALVIYAVGYYLIFNKKILERV